MLKENKISTSFNHKVQQQQQGLLETEAFGLAGKEDELHQQNAAQQQQLREAAAKLSLQRQAAGKKLKTAVESSLAQLAMEGCEFEVQVAWSQSQEVGNSLGKQPPPRPHHPVSRRVPPSPPCVHICLLQGDLAVKTLCH